MKKIYQILKFFIGYTILTLLFLSALLMLLSPLTAFMITDKWYYLLGFLFSFYLSKQILKLYEIVHDKMRDNMIK